MIKKWSTEHKDMRTAQMIMEKYASRQNSQYLGLFELVFSQPEKLLKFKIADWVVVLATHYSKLYGATQGEYVTRCVISRCMVQNETLH